MKRIMMQTVLLVSLVGMFASCGMIPITGDVYGGGSVEVHSPPAPPQQSSKREGMPAYEIGDDARAYAALYERMRYARSDRERLGVLSESYEGVSMQQAISLLRFMDKDNRRLEALAMLLPRIYVLENERLLIDAFYRRTYAQEAAELIRQHISRYGRGRGYPRGYREYEGHMPQRGYDYPPRSYDRDPRALAMTPSDFDRFYQDVRRATFDREKMELISMMGSMGYFTCEQVARLMKIFTFDREKLPVARILIPRIVDPTSFSLVVEALDFLSSKKEVQDLFREHFSSRGERYGSGRLYPRAMSPTDFDRFYDAVHRQTWDDDRLAMISTAAAAGFFSCSQVARLMRFFSFDDGKMKVFRLLAPRLVDPERSYEILKELTFSSAKEEASSLLRRYYDR